MATVALTTDTFDSTVAQDGVVIVDFWADWCGPCKRFAPIFENSSQVRADIVHAKVDTEAFPELQERYSITSIPTIQVFRDGVLVFQQAGALPAGALHQVITAVEGLDMDEVRAKVADAQA